MDNLSKVIQELRRLNEPVPKPLRLPTREEVDAAEQRLGVMFHPTYRRYLLEASDVIYGQLELAVAVPSLGYLDLIDTAIAAWATIDLPRNLLPICEDNSDYFCMDVSGTSGKVIYWSHNGMKDESWPDVATWIKEVWIEGH